MEKVEGESVEVDGDTDGDSDRDRDGGSFVCIYVLCIYVDTYYLVFFLFFFILPCVDLTVYKQVDEWMLHMRWIDGMGWENSKVE